MIDHEHHFPAQQVPAELLVHGIDLAGEIMVPVQWAAHTVDEVARQYIAVVGVEVFRNDQGAPLWIASSEYRCDLLLPWDRYVECCAQGAQRFIAQFSTESGAVFSFAWMRQEEAGSLR